MEWNVLDRLPYNNEAGYFDMITLNGATEHIPWPQDPFSIFTNLDSDVSATPTTGGEQSPLTPSSFPHNGQQLASSNLALKEMEDKARDLSPMTAEGRRSAGFLPFTSESDTSLTGQPHSAHQSKPIQTTMTIIPETGIPKIKSFERRKRRSLRHTGHSGSPVSSGDENDAGLRAKQMHMAVERRYRDNLNQKFEQLSKTLKATASSRLPDLEDATRRTRKVDVLADAVGYINRSEVKIRHMSDEIDRLNEQLRLSQILSINEDTISKLYRIATTERIQ